MVLGAGETWLPTQFVFQFGRINGVSHIVPRSILHIGDQRSATLLDRTELVEKVTNLMHDVDIPEFAVTADIVCFARLPFLKACANFFAAVQF